MPSLAEVVGSVLSASTAAQHLANETSAQLAPIYREHEILRHYPLPNVALQEIELELKFAFAEDALLTGPPTAPPAEPEGRAGGAAQAGRPSGSALTRLGVAARANVVVQADLLAHLPERAIQTLRLRLAVRDLRWVRSQAGGDELITG